MATFAQIKSIRISIDDPSGFQDIIEVSTSSLLPSVPAPYSSYKIVDTGKYVSTAIESGATENDYNLLSLRVSDSNIESWIDDYSVAQAKCKAIEAIIFRIGNELMLKKASVGAEDIEYSALKDMLSYYKSLLDMCKSDYNSDQLNNTGRYGTTEQPEIAGGEI